MDEEFPLIEDYLAFLNLERKRNVWLGNKQKFDFILKKLANYFKPSLEICDIGIGNAYLITRLYNLNLNVTGIDISGYLINHFKNKFKQENKNIRLIKGSISNLTLQKNQFDIITCFDVLEHIPGEGLQLAIKKH